MTVCYANGSGRLLALTTKPFDRTLYNRDDDAKDDVIAWVARRYGYHLYVNPDQYGIDLLCDNGWSFEVEVKHNWRGNKFPYQEVHFSARKLKFANRRSIFVMLNSERTRGLLVAGDVVRRSKIVRKATKYTADEQFIEVPVRLCELVTLN